MTHKKRLALFAGIFLLLLALFTFIPNLLKPEPRPPDVPEGWKLHKDILGRFELWLPKDWEELGVLRTVIEGLTAVAKGDECPILFSAWRYRPDGRHESVIIQIYDSVFELHAPLGGEELARECSKENPPFGPALGLGEVVRLDDSKVVTLELEGSEFTVAYQSDVLAQGDSVDLVRTLACVVSENHAYLVHIDTLERQDKDADTPAYEIILRTFRVLKSRQT